MLRFAAQGFFSWVVLNEQDKIVRYAPHAEPNLILDQGLDGIAVRSWADSFVVCAVGTGTSNPAKAQTGLESESRRTATYLDLVSANSSSLSGNEFTMRRTFVFPKEGGLTTYTEAGFGYSLVGPNNLFSRVKLPNVQVSANERLVVQYQLVVFVFPITPKALTNPITIKNAVSTGVFQYQLLGLKGVNSSGQTYNYDAASGCNEPSTAANGFLSINSSAPAAFPTAVDRSGTTYDTAISLSTYVPGTFTRNKIFSVTKKLGVRGNWRSVGLGATTAPYTNTGLVHVSAADMPKAVGQLDVVFSLVWGRYAKEKPGTLYYWQDDEELSVRYKTNLLLDYFGQTNG